MSPSLSSLRIVVHIQVQSGPPAEGEQMSDIEELAPGRFALTIPQAQMGDIDAFEVPLLTVAFVALRSIMSAYLTDCSHQFADTLAHARAGLEVCPHPAPYRIDGAAGRFTFQTHDLVNEQGEVVATTATEWPAQRGEAWYYTQEMRRLSLFYGTVQQAYQPATEMLNRWRRQEKGGTPTTTLRDLTEREGQQVCKQWDTLAHDLLTEARVIMPPEGAVSVPVAPPPTTAQLPTPQVEAALTALGASAEVRAELEANPIPLEDPAQTVYGGVDGVAAKKQRPHRRRASAPAAHTAPADAPETKRVNNRTAYLQCDQQTHYYVAGTYPSLLKLLLACLLASGLATRRLCFFVDGERALNMTLLTWFGWHHQLQIILDWWHLIEKCRQLTSLAFAGRQVRNQHMKQMNYLLWYGRVRAVLQYLEALPPGDIKHRQHFDELCQYLRRQQSHIPCYALRKALGLPNSSNFVEKTNDRMVSKRQKHNGMSWSEPGSLGLAALSAVRMNSEEDMWLPTHTLGMRLGRAEEKLAAA